MAQTTFDINKFLAGQPAVTQSGKPIGKLKEVHYRETAVTFLTAIVDAKPAIWDITGKFVSGTDNGMDLFMDDPVIYHWALTKDILDIDPDKPNKYTKVIIAS